MKFTSKEIQSHYDGFLQTPCLWKKDVVFSLNQFEIQQKSAAFNLEINQKIRLGKYIERFVTFQLQQEKSIKIIVENIQIQQNKITLGELDCLLIKDKKPIHLEIIYKFYLFDETVGTTEVDHFIGPNRKDSLVDKLIKLKEKQLPLLYSNECKSYLEQLNLEVSKIKQQVYFKAQLFVPFSNQEIELSTLNKGCIAGFYINQQEIHQFKDYKFYFPTKKDWLVVPHTKVDWQNFDEFLVEFKSYETRQFSPLCWLKKANGELFKIFVVWW